MILALTIALLIGSAVYLIQQRGLVRIVLGMMAFGHGANLMLLATGVYSYRGESFPSQVPHDQMADPLPQAMMRPATSTEMRRAKRNTSFMSCSMSRITRPGARKSRMAANSDRRPSSSTWAAGSSKIMTSGALATAPAMAIRWRSPPDSDDASWSPRPARPTGSRAGSRSAR